MSFDSKIFKIFFLIFKKKFKNIQKFELYVILFLS